MKGVTVIEKDNYSIIFIHEFSEEFKSAIRSKLSTICHGAADAVTGHSLYSYSNTIKDFIKRYNDKTDSQRKGMIGELLVHILLTEQLTGFTVNSPFFNTEERNVKKGVDVVLRQHRRSTSAVLSFHFRFYIFEKIIIEKINDRDPQAVA